MIRNTPAQIEVTLGFASHKYNAAKTKPTGTLIRRAIAAHLVTLTPQ
jgi:hypothetical protein